MYVVENQQITGGGVIIASVTCLLACGTKVCVNDSSADKTAWLIPDTTALCDSIVREWRDILFCPDSVLCYTINYRDTVGLAFGHKVVEGFARDSLHAKLNDSQTAVLLYLLPSNSKNYFCDSLIVQSPYLPELEFEFAKNDTQRVSIVVSESDLTWQIAIGGKTCASFNYVDRRAVARFCSLIKRAK